jgi:hypothetical protein
MSGLNLSVMSRCPPVHSDKQQAHASTVWLTIVDLWQGWLGLAVLAYDAGWAISQHVVDALHSTGPNCSHLVLQHPVLL